MLELARSSGTVDPRALRRRRGALAAVLMVLYVAADLLLRPAALPGSHIIPWYPGAGLALAALALMGGAWAPVLFVARLLLLAWPPAAYPLHGLLVAEAALHTALYVGGAVVIRRRVLGGLGSWQVRHAMWLLAAIVFTAVAAAVVSALQLDWSGARPRGAFWKDVVTFAVGDAAGAIVVLPATLLLLRSVLGTGTFDVAVAREPRGGPHPDEALAAHPSRRERAGEVLAVLAAIVVARELFLHGGTAREYIRVVCLLPLAWVALREGLRGAVAVVFVFGVACAVVARSPAVPADAMPLLQSMLLTLGVVGLLLGTARLETAESAARYWHLLAISREGIWRVDAAGRTLYVNERMAEILGRPVGEIVGHPVRDFIHPDDRARWEGERDRREAGEDSVYEVRVLRGDGGTAATVVSAGVVRSTAGEPIGSVAVVTDVTELRRAEVAGNRAQRLLEAAFRSAQDAMVIVRVDDGRIVDVNDVWSAMTGVGRADAIGRRIASLGVWGDPADSARLEAALREHGALRGFEIAFDRREGDGVRERRHAVLSARPAVVDEGTYVLVTGRDITVERRREQAERQLRRLEELGRLAGGVAHDFNNLLTVVLGYAQLAHASLAAGEPVALADIREIEQAGERGRELTRRLLAFSRSQPGEPRVVDVRDVVDRSHGMLKSILGGEIALEIRQAEEALQVLADPAQVDQILLNLAVNARDAMPEGGSVTVTTAALDAAPGEVADLVGPDALPGRYAVLQVADTGAGMDETTQAHIFEPFFTTKPAGEGTGLGLAVVFGIVRQARGGIRVASAPGAGATFTVCWPLAAPSTDAPVTPTRQAGDGAGRCRGRVLLVEDEVMVRRIAQRVLEDAGYEVSTAANGESALECLAELDAAGAPPDVVLSDVIMPRLGGRALAERLGALRPRLPVVLMSGHTGNGDVADGLANVPLPVLGKPFEVTQLLDAVAKAMRTGTTPATAAPAE